MKSNKHETSLNYVILAVGSNIDPHFNVEQAKKTLSQDHQLLASSKFIETEPVGFQDQPNFLNGAFYVATLLAYDEFNLYLKGVEIRQDRIKGPIKSGPRTIDLDIIIWNTKIVDEDFYSKFYINKPVEELIQKRNLSIIR